MKSKIIYLKHKFIDKKKWDSCIDHSKNGMVFAYSWYLDCVFKNWDAIILNDYQAVFPLPVKSKFGIKYMLNPMFTPELGLFCVNNIKPELLIDFIDAIPSNVRLINYNLNFLNSNILNLNFQITQKKCQLIELNETYESIKKKYSSNLKRNISKALKNNLIIKTSIQVSNVVSIFKENKGKQLRELKDSHYFELNLLLNEIIKKEKGIIYECWLENEILAIAFFSISNNQIIYIKGGSTSIGRSLNAMHLIMDHVIKKHSNSEYQFNFGGSSISDVAKFNYQFGATEYLYYSIYKNTLPFPLNLIKK